MDEQRNWGSYDTYQPNYLSLSPPLFEEIRDSPETVAHDNVTASSSTEARQSKSSSMVHAPSPGPRSANSSASRGSSEVFKEAINAILDSNHLSLGKLGRAIHHFDGTVEYQEFLVKKLKDVKINVDHLKNMQQNVETLQPSSDSIVRTLSSVVREQAHIITGMGIAMDTMLSMQRDMLRKFEKTSHHIAKSAERTLPQGLGFSIKNLKRVWEVNVGPPFKNVNLRDVLEKWHPSPKAGKNHFLHILDFLRHYFSRACTPPPEIQRFACRQAGKRGKFEHLTDLPEAFVEFLIDFVLDAIGLGDEGLLLPVANHKEYRTKFWMELAGNDADRETMFNTLSDARTDWSALARVAIGRALADVRAFTYKNTDQPLVPSHKRKIVTQDI
ncbi:hypothetical protein Y032_0016g2990 [Ancylostoma ceylanicum]|nr:hypothetical protein Y032_0016g2990 [Ancylostoma ceylanicum]